MPQNCGSCSRNIGGRRPSPRAMTTCKVVVVATGACLGDGLGRCRVFTTPAAAKAAAVTGGLETGAYSIVAVKVL